MKLKEGDAIISNGIKGKVIKANPFDEYVTVLTEDDNKELESIFDLIFSSDHLSMNCDECGNQFEFNMALVNEIREDYLYTCQKCGFVERLGQYFVSDELLSHRRKIMIDNSDSKNWKLVK